MALFWTETGQKENAIALAPPTGSHHNVDALTRCLKMQRIRDLVFYFQSRLFGSLERSNFFRPLEITGMYCYRRCCPVFGGDVSE